jgi:hypothetical protein
MLCPQCGARNPLGAQRCAACGRAFTRAALAADAPPVLYQGGYVGQPSDTRRGRSRRRHVGCLTALGALALVLVLALVGVLAFANYVVKPYVRDAARSDLRTAVRGEVAGQLATQVGALPDGQVTVTDADVNQRIAASGDLGPINNVKVSFTPTGVDIKLSAYGMDGTYHATPRVVNGSIELDGGALDGALGYVVPADDLQQIVNQEIAATLQDAGYVVNDVTLGDGQMTLTVAHA